MRDPKEAGLKKNSAAVHKYLEELVKIGKIFNYALSCFYFNISRQHYVLVLYIYRFCLIYQIFAGKKLWILIMSYTILLRMYDLEF